MTPTYVLLVDVPGKQVRQLQVTESIFLIGRDEGDLILDDPKCSARHLKLVFDGHSVLYRDLESTNGTYLADQRVDAGNWEVGDVLSVGKTKLTLFDLQGSRELGKTQVLGSAVEKFQTQPMSSRPMPGPDASGTSLSPLETSPQRERELSLLDEGHEPSFLPPKRPPGTRVWISLTLVLLALGGAYGWNKIETARLDSSVKKVATEADVRFVWYRGEGENAKGGSSISRIRVMPNSSKRVSVGVQEEFAGGGGSQWRTAVWMASFNSARLMGKSLTDYEFTVYTGGHVDGPSAGMLTTAAMLAILNGQEVRRDTTMTGTINPDGTAGPVGGIAFKLEAAKEAGLKRVGIPLGAQNEEQVEGEPETFKDMGKSLGLEVREIDDIYEAYEFLTGAQLPRTNPLRPEEMGLLGASRILASRVKVWSGYLGDGSEELRTLAKDERIPKKMATSMIASLNRSIERAVRFEEKGQLAAALDGYAEALLQQRISMRLIETLGLLQRRKFERLLKLAEGEGQVKREVALLRQEQLALSRKSSRSAQIGAAFTLSRYVNAKTAIDVAVSLRENEVGQLEKCMKGPYCRITEALTREVVRRVFLPAMYEEIASVYLDFARALRGIETSRNEVPALGGAQLNSLVAGYASASGAVLEYLDALITETTAKKLKLTKEAMQQLIAQKEPSYLLAKQASVVAGTDKMLDGELAEPVLRLAAASTAYLTGASLLNKWYALSPKKAPGGEVKVGNLKALERQLLLAERGAREAAARAKKSSGFVPMSARFNYQLAESKRPGDEGQKLSALESYWESSFWSELASAR